MLVLVYLSQIICDFPVGNVEESHSNGFVIIDF